jgi:tetratricopeptide (TPR) repeat protein
MMNTRYDYDYFISYAGGDVAWAKWVAWVLEVAGYRVFYQKQDIHPGNDFMREMNRAVQSSERIIPILSPRYFASEYTYVEWTPFKWDDLRGEKRLIIPICVELYPERNLLSPVSYINFVGLKDKEQARQRLLNGIGNQEPGKFPTRDEPAFPGNRPTDASTLPPRNPAAVTFEAEIDQTQKAMEADHVAAVLPPDLPGRKAGDEANTIATEYAHRYQSQYDVIIWGDASNENALKQTQKDILHLLDPATSTNMNDTLEIIEQVKQVLRRQKNWLLIFSNVFDPFPSSIYDLLAIARSGSGHILITTQQLSPGRINNIIKAHKMSAGEEDLVQYLVQMRDAKLRNPVMKTVWRLGLQGVTIGRAAGNDIELGDDDVVSSRHAAVRLGKGGYKIIDLKSTNKTFINGSPILVERPYQLLHKDAIKVGRTTLIYEIGEIVCPHCLYPHDPNTTTCPRTHKSVNFSPYIKAPEKGFILCLSCHQECAEDKKYCNNCGKALLSKKQLLHDADALYHQKKYQEARDTYEQVLQLNRKQLEAHCGKGKASYQLGEYDDAYQAFEQALKLQPGDQESFSWQGKTLYQRSDYKEALEVFHDLIGVDPNNADWQRWIGRSHDKLKEYKQALLAFNSALNTDRNHADTHNRKGNTLYRLGNYQEAVDSYDEAIRLAPKKAIAYNGRGHALGHLPRYREALEAFETALRLDPDLAEAHVGKGNILLDLDKPEDLPQALAAFERALQIDPELVSAYCGKYKALYRLGRKIEAETARKEAARRGEICP